MDNLLEIKNLYVEINDREHGVFNAVSDLDLYVKKGQVLGMVGESGSGKSVTVLAIMGLSSSDSKIASGSIFFGGTDMTKLKSNEYAKIRGKQISMIFQDPMASLNPLIKVGKQVEENLRLHSNIRGSQLKAQAISAMKYAGLKEAEDLYNAYPHQLSGGMRQRIMIASATICESKLIIADEPTTALDSTTQTQILELFKKMKAENDTAMMFISHDFGIISKISDTVIVMYRGYALEYGSCNDIINNAYHPYTRALIKCIPSADKRGTPLYRIKVDEEKSNNPHRCPFAGRCDYALDKCKQSLPAWTHFGERRVRCIRFGEI